jgi:hypothetical protein
MAINYAVAEKFLQASFAKMDSPSKLAFPAAGSLSTSFQKLLKGKTQSLVPLPHKDAALMASASVEMWHRAIHSFVWSVAMTESSHLWASVSGYYASHFIMRAFAHSLGIYKSFALRKEIQIVFSGGQFSCALSTPNLGEHEYYWKVVKDYPKFAGNPLFRTNYQHDETSDATHRTYANYIDHLDGFAAVSLPAPEEIALSIEKISRIRLYSVTEASRDDYPDLQNVQILAFQRIVAFQDFLDSEIPKNRFWKAHRRPQWCRVSMIYQLDDQNLEQPEAA